MLERSPLERLLRRDRAILTSALLTITALAWYYLVRLDRSMPMSAGMGTMPGMMMPMTADWRLSDFALTFTMWSVMMAGMMVPSAVPTVLTFALVNRRRAERGAPYAPAGIFLAGYLAAWTAFSFLATFAEWRLHIVTLLDPHTQTVAPRLAASLLIVAGLFQITPFKHACLKHCRSPLEFLTAHWREGWAGALQMGLKHGLFCVGCCWMLMALLFVAGVMNLLWVAMIAGFVLVEKLAPRTQWVTYAGAAACILAGVFWLGRSLRLG